MILSCAMCSVFTREELQLLKLVSYIGNNGMDCIEMPENNCVCKWEPDSLVCDIIQWMQGFNDKLGTNYEAFSMLQMS